MEDPTLNELIRNTELFFEHHWNVDLLGTPPEWSPVHFNFGKIPNYDKQGVYAFIKGDLVTYIGVGTSRGAGRYRGNGLSARVMKYCRWNEDKTEYIPGIITLVVCIVLAYVAFVLIRKYSKKQEQRAQEFEQEVLNKINSDVHDDHHK